MSRKIPLVFEWFCVTATVPQEECLGGTGQEDFIPAQMARD